MAAKHLTRREIKEEGTLEHGLTSLTEWVVFHWKPLLMGLGGIAVVVLGAYFWTQFQGQRDAAVQLRFARALESFHGTVEPPAGDPESAATPADPGTPDIPPADFATVADRARQALEQFNAIAADYPGSRLGLLSRYYAGLSHRDLNDNQAARTALVSVIDEADAADIRNLARTALAGILSSEADHAGAAAQLEAILAEEEAVFPARSTVMRLASEYEAAGDLANAVATYRRVLNEFPTSEDARTARSKVDQMEALLPAPDDQNAPPPESGS